MLNHEVQAFATLYATAVGQYRKRGYFTTAAVEALAGKAASERGEVTLNALVKYVQDQVPQRVKLMGGHEQKPFAVIEGFKADELVIAAIEPGAVTVTVTPPSDTERLFWTAIQNSDDSKDYEEYLTRWPQGDFAGLARRRFARLTSSRARPALPPAPVIVTPSKTGVRTGPGGVSLSKFTFETVTTNGFGKITKRLQAEAWQYVEELADGVTLELVEVTGGEFLMGTADDEIEKVISEMVRVGASKSNAESWMKSEATQHRVNVPTFFFGKFAVTQAQWKAVTGSLPNITEKLQGDLLPVVNVLWDEAKEFCQELGDGYRLPSEAEWEYACRAGKSTPFTFGPTVTPEIVNYDGNHPYGHASKGKNRGKPMPVGSFPANAWGLFEMHGNVWEWCEDDWHDSYKEKGVPLDGSAW